MMKIEHLRYFLTVARVGSTNKAAEELFLTSQNLGLIMKNIEKELGKVLFIRTPKGMQLTTEGEKFVPYAQEIVAVFDKYLISNKKSGDILNFYTAPALAKELKGLQDKKWADQYYLSIIKRNPQELVQMIQNGTEGIFFFALPRKDRAQLHYKGRQTILFSEEEMIQFCHKSNALLVNAEHPEEAVKNYLTIRMETYNAAVEKHDADNSAIMYIDDIALSKKMMRERNAVYEITPRFYQKYFQEEEEWVVLHRKPVPMHDFVIFYNHESNWLLEDEIKEFISAAF